MKDVILELASISKSFDGKPILDNLDLLADLKSLTRVGLCLREPT